MCYDVVEKPKPKKRSLQRNQTADYVHDTTIDTSSHTYRKSSDEKVYDFTGYPVSINPYPVIGYSGSSRINREISNVCKYTITIWYILINDYIYSKNAGIFHPNPKRNEKNE